VKRTSIITLIGFVTILMSLGMMADPTVHAQPSLRYSCSAQVFEAFETERIPAFIEATGINVELYICSSDAAVNRLMTDYSEIASTTLKLAYPRRECGYVETTFCKDPLAIIVNEQCPIADVSEKQLQGIFSKSISNWRCGAIWHWRWHRSGHLTDCFGSLGSRQEFWLSMTAEHWILLYN